MRPNLLVTILRDIPDSRTIGVPVSKLIDVGGDPAEVETTSYAMGAIDLLILLGAVVSVDGESDVIVKNRSHSSLYFLRALAAVAQLGDIAVPDWTSKGVGLERDVSATCGKAVNLIHMLDTRLHKLDPNAKPLRTEKVAQALIARPSPTGEGLEFLVQYDAHAKRYQLIGGRFRETDLELHRTMQRECVEELDIVESLRDKLQFLLLAEGVRFVRQSATYGVNTEYEVNYYQLVEYPAELPSRPENRWVTLSEMREGLTFDSIEILSDEFVRQQIDWTRLRSSFVGGIGKWNH